MRSALGRLAVVAVLSAPVACTRPAGQQTTNAAAAAGRTDRTILTQTQMGDHRFSTAYEVVEALRSNWLNTKGPDSFSRPSIVRVYLDNISLGDKETLKTIAVTTIVYIRYFDGVSATARWGLDHGGGVIYVSTRPLSSDPDT